MTTIPCKQSARFAEALIDGEVLLMDMDSGKFFTLRDSAAGVWKLIDGARDRDGILSQLHDDFSGPRDGIASDLDALLATLKAAGFVA